MTIRSLLHRLLLAALFAVLARVLVAAQPAPQPAAPPGLATNSGQPVKIESTSLELRDKSRVATFLGNVKLTQGDTIVQCKTMVVYYEDTPTGAPAPKSGAKIAGPSGGQQQIKRVEVKGNVIVTQKDQTASGDNGLFDVKANTVTLTGNVVLTQGQNVVRGEKMVADLNTGKYTMESCKSGCRVEMLAFPNAKDTKPLPTPNPSPAPPAKGAPTRTN